MATGGFRSNAATDFLEEWKAKREKMRAKMLGDITASAVGYAVAPSSLGSSSSSSSSNNNKNENRNVAPNTELNNNGNPDRGGSSSVHCVSSNPVARSPSSATRRPEDNPQPPPTARAPDPLGGNLKKAPSTPPSERKESDAESPSPGTGSSKAKEKKSSGPSARKGKGQIEKRKLREKRRSTGVVSIPSTESLDELDDNDGREMAGRRDQAVTQQNTVQNEVMTSDPAMAHLQDTPRAATGRYKSPGSEEEAGGNSRHRVPLGRHGKETTAALERRIAELEKELARERHENGRLLKGLEDKEELVEKLREDIDLLNRDLDDLEDENEQLKQENKTLLKVVGQLTR